MTKISKICAYTFWAVAAVGQNTPVSLQSLIGEARQNNAAITAAERAIQTSEYMPKPASALLDSEVMLQSFSVEGFAPGETMRGHFGGPFFLPEILANAYK